MTTLNQSATQPNTAVEKKHEWPTYYKTLVRSGYAPVNGLQMYYEIHGTGKPLVTIHPVWGLADVFPSLISHRQLIAVELQGHGRTADIDRPLTFEQHAEDVATLLKHLQIEQADVFGESIGGIVAVMMAVRHPDLIGRVATYATSFSKFGPPVGLSSADGYSVQFPRENYQKVAPDPTHWPMLFAKTQRMEWQGFSPDELKSIKAPILIATGDHDYGLSVEHSVEMFRLIPNAQLAVIPDAGHFVLSVDPEKLLPIVAAFLDEPISTVPFATPQTGYHPGVTR
jgi:pimeloyl-ACP methyl ester carboxylesterase